MEDLMKNIDLYLEHRFHKWPEEKCSTCFNEMCQDCNGIGEVSTMEAVYPNEPHMAMVGTEPCENCDGGGFELDERVIEERYA